MYEEVSILVLLEVPLQLYTMIGYRGSNEQFQSLFYWKYHFNHKPSSVRLHTIPVSILVLLEVPLQLSLLL